MSFRPLSTVCFLLLLAPSARAQSAEQAPSPDVEAVATPDGQQGPAVRGAQGEDDIDPRAEYHKGNAAFREGRLTTARFHYRRSVEAEISFDAMCNLGRTEAALGDDVAAYEHLTKCVDLHPADPELLESRGKFQELRREVEQRMSDEQKQLAARRLALLPRSEASEPEAESRSEVRSSKAKTIVAVTAGAVAVVGLGVGTGLFLHGQALGDEATGIREDIQASDGTCAGASPHPSCEDLFSALQSSDTAHNASVVTLAVSGGLLVGAVLTYLLWPSGEASATESGGERVAEAGREGREKSASRLTWSPQVAVDVPAGSAWLGVRGRF